MPYAKTLWNNYRADRKAGKPRITRPFSGRNDFRLAYFHLLERALDEKFENYYVVNYYGAPGMGKSALLRRLEMELTGDDSVLPDDSVRESCLAAKRKVRAYCGERKPVVLRADFDDPGLSSVQDVLFAFRTQLIQQTDMFFPFFDLAMELLYQKQGRYLKNVEKEQEKLINDPILSFLWDTAVDKTGVGKFITIGKVVKEAGEKYGMMLRDREKPFKATYEEIRDLDVPELLRRLPMYFAMDVNASGLPLICVFLDTYEMAYSRAEGAGYQAGLDEGWLAGPYGLIRQLGNAVFAVAGREKLNVESEDWKPLCFGSEDSSRLPIQRLEPLSDTETTSFLTGCGLTPELARELHELTGGDPVYLELCLDQYEAMCAAGKKPSGKADFGGSCVRLVERHTRYLPAHLREPLCILAALERWNDEQYAQLQRELPMPLPVMESADYIRLTGLSYVRKEKDTWAMHETIACVLASMLTSGVRGMLVQAAVRLGDSARKTFDMESAARWYSYAAAQLDACPSCLPLENACSVWEQWAELCEETGRAAERIMARRKALELRVALYGGKKGGNTEPWATYELGRAYFDAERYEDALPLLRECAHAYAKAMGPNEPLTLLSAGLYQAACMELGKEENDPLANIGWDYHWTGNETPGQLIPLCKWWRLRVNYSEYGYYTENHEFLQKLAAALKAAPDTVRSVPAALWAEMQLTQQFAEQQCDSALTSRHAAEMAAINISPLSEAYGDWERKWEQTPLLREPEVVLQTCAELVEHHKRALAADDPMIANALGTLAFTQEHQCLYHLAVVSRQEALGLYRKAYGDDSTDTLDEEARLIEDYRKAERFSDAIRQQQLRMDRLRGEKDEPLPAELRNPWKKELKTMAALRRQMLQSAEDASEQLECIAALQELWREYTDLCERLDNEYDILPWGRAAVWCLTHPESDVPGVTEEFVTGVVEQCRRHKGERMADAVLQNMENADSWRGRLTEHL